MLNISLLEFIRTGSFGPLKEPFGRDRILTLLGAPDDFSCNPSEEESVYVLLPGGESEYRPATKPRELVHAGIWFYDDFEIHFTKRADDAVAWMVFTDHFDHDRLSGGASLQVDPWVIEKGLRLDSFVKHLERERIGTVTQEHRPGLGDVKVVVPSGVEVVFCTDVQPPDWRISFICCVWQTSDPESEPDSPLPNSP